MLKNFVPLPYRRVSVQPYSGPWTEEAIRDHLLNRDAYRRTNFVILHGEGGTCCVVSIKKMSDEPLFSQIVQVKMLAAPESCLWVDDMNVDTGNRSALAKKAYEMNLTMDKTLVVRGRYEHTNFIHHPEPLYIRVIEVIPPETYKLYEMANLVLQYADLPPIRLELHGIYMKELAAEYPTPEAYLIPCRASGLELSQPVLYLDEHPEYQNWVLIGCERSCHIHKHFYGHDPKRIEVCPRLLIPPSDIPTLSKCCLLESHVETEGNYAVVPWGANLKHVEDALRIISDGWPYSEK